MTVGVGGYGNLYDLRGLLADMISVDLSKLGVGSTYFAIDTSDVYMFNGIGWTKL